MPGTTTRRSARLGIILAGLWVGSDWAATLQPQTIEVDGVPREYILASPATTRDEPRPLVLVLHGHLGTAKNALGGGDRASPLSAWLDIADRERILVAALQGLKGSDGHTGWNDCRTDDAGNSRADDVAFASAVVRHLVASGKTDVHRVYVMGMSNGAMMSYRLALEMQPSPAAIAAASGTMAVRGDCRSATVPVSVLIIHGTADPLVPYTGGPVGFGGRGKRGEVLGAEATRDYWLRVDGLARSTPVSVNYPHLGTDKTQASKATYGADSGPQVELITIEHGGHVEPSLRFHYGALYGQIVGTQNRDFESAEEAWAFFAPKHRE
jgi:polyhydroxybutyrate depolymerase